MALEKDTLLNGNGRGRHERWRDLDFPIAWINRGAAGMLLAVIVFLAIKIYEETGDSAGKIQWLIGSVSGMQTQVNQTQDQVRQLYDVLLQRGGHDK